MQHEHIVAEFTHQAESFNSSEVARAAAALDVLVELAAPARNEHWLEAACGPGLLARALAPTIASVHGVDLTPAMVEVARREARAVGLTNATFETADATAMGGSAAEFDGAIARFTIHHLPVPSRLVEELCRVVRPGGVIVLADIAADEDAETFAFSQEIERLRDPSHWACLPLERLRALGLRAGLALEDERKAPLVLDFEDWLRRGSGGPANRALIEQALAERTATDESPISHDADGRRRIRYTLWMSRWRRPRESRRAGDRAP